LQCRLDSEIRDGFQYLETLHTSDDGDNDHDYNNSNQAASRNVHRVYGAVTSVAYIFSTIVASANIRLRHCRQWEGISRGGHGEISQCWKGKLQAVNAVLQYSGVYHKEGATGQKVYLRTGKAIDSDLKEQARCKHVLRTNTVIPILFERMNHPPPLGQVL
jgi:hypothetical protein